MAKQILLGPSNPGAEQQFDGWYHGAYGEAYLSVDDTGSNRGSNNFTLGNKIAAKENSADWRSQLFSLGPAADGAEPITFSFAYKFPGTVHSKDNISVFLRFFDKTGTNFLGQIPVLIGSSSGDSEMTGYKTVTLTGLRARKNATGIRLPKGARTTTADIWVTCNVFQPWTSGDARFDDFAVTTVKRFPLLKVIISAALLLSVTAVPVVLLLYSKRRKQLAVGVG